MEIGILADQREMVLSGIFPNVTVGTCAQTDSGNVRGLREMIRQGQSQGRGEIFVKQEFQEFTAS